jgi:Pyridoxamine 5'-phosphate oxidase
MHETPDELTALDRLLTESLHRSTEHLRSIVTEGDRTLDATETCQVLTGMRTLSLATVTERGEPRISGVDGHFLHARWVFTTSGTSAKVRHLRRRPAVSVAHLVGDDLGVFCHGQVEELTEDHPDRAAVEAHLTAHYGSSPSSWGPEIYYGRVQPHWMVTYAFAKDALLAEAAGTEAGR